MIGLSVPVHRLMRHLLSYTLTHDFFISVLDPTDSFTFFKDIRKPRTSASDTFVLEGVGNGVGTGAVVVILYSLVKVKAFA